MAAVKVFLLIALAPVEAVLTVAAAVFRLALRIADVVLAAAAVLTGLAGLIDLTNYFWGWLDTARQSTDLQMSLIFFGCGFVLFPVLPFAAGLLAELLRMLNHGIRSLYCRRFIRGRGGRVPLKRLLEQAKDADGVVRVQKLNLNDLSILQGGREVRVKRPG